MRIAIVIYSMGGGGAERVTSILANYWNEQGHTVELVTFAGQEADAYILKPGIQRTTLELEAISSSFFQAIKGNAKRIIKLRRNLKIFKPDLVLGMMTGAAVTALLATRGLKVPVIVSERAHPPMCPLNKFWSGIRYFTYPWAKYVVMLSTKSLDWLNTNIPKANGIVIQNPLSYPLAVCEPILSVNGSIAPTRKFILAAGRLDNQKGFDLLIKAFFGINGRFKEWDLVILGDGPERKSIESQIQYLGLTNRVKLPGRAGNIGEWYSSADLYVMSSRFEGFPNTLLEAMAHGCPVIAYDCDTGPKDIIRHGVDGLLVNPVGGLHALQSAMEELMSDDIRRKKMGLKALECANKFLVPKIMSLWAKYLAEC